MKLCWVCMMAWVLPFVPLLAGCGDDESLKAVGQLAWDRAELVAEAAEPIVSIAVTQGQQVDAGTLLLQLDTTRAEAQALQAAAARRQAAARLAEIERGTRDERVSAARAELEGAEAAFDAAAREYQRLQKLAAERLVSPGQLDQARAERDSARAKRDSAKANLEELVHGATREQLLQAQAALAEAEAAERIATVTLERLTVRAPRAGRVDALPFEVGERPNAGAVVAVLLVGAAPYARVYIPEPVRVRIVPGLSAKVYVDGVGEPFSGKVRQIRSDEAFTPYFALTENDRSRLSYLAEVVLEGNPRTLPAGIPVEVVFAESP